MDTANDPDNQLPPRTQEKHFKRLFLLLTVSLLLVVATVAFVWVTSRQTTPDNLSTQPVQPANLAEQYTLQLIDKAQELKTVSDKQPVVDQIIDISKKRQQAMRDLLHEDPAAFLMIAQPDGFSSILPAEAAQFTERAVEIDGKLEVRHGEIINGEPTDDEGHKNIQPFYEYFIDHPAGRDQVYLDHELKPELYGKKVKLKGVRLDKDIAALAEGNVTLASDESATTAVAAPVEKKVAILLFNFTTNTTKPWTVDQVRNAIFVANNSTDSYYRENSFGIVGLSGVSVAEGDVLGWYTISDPITTCSPDAWATSAKAAAQSAGYNMANYTNLVFAFPRVSACGWGGIGVMPGGTSWINGYATDPRIVGHELGHNFGVHHASGLNCTSSTGTRVTISDTCTLDEYGDMFDIMGYGFNHLGNYQKGRLGYYPSAGNTLTAAGGTNQYKVLPIETSTTGVQSLRVPRSYDSSGKPIDFYYIESRKTYGFDNYATTAPAVTGVTIRIGSDYPVLNKTQLLDMTPATTSYTDAPLLVGKEFVDSKRGISIKTISADATGATVSVTTTAPPCTRANPVMALTPTSQWANPGNTLSYTLSVTNKDDSFCQPSQFNLTSQQDSSFTQTQSATSLTLAPGATGIITVQVTAGSTITSGTHNFTETITNSAATAYKASATGAFNIYDQATLPPVVTITQPADGAHIGSRATVLATASSKGSIAKIDMYVNGVLEKSASAVTSVDFTLNTRKYKTANMYTVVVKAYDTQGRSGVASITLYK